MVNETIRDEIFISYSRADTEVLNKLKRHFSIFKNKVNIWDDSKILAGEEWKKSIEIALAKTKIAILLISADFFSSDFINCVELPNLLRAAENNGAIILSLIVKPCLYNEYPEINKFQALNSPTKTISQMTVSEQEEIFVKLALRIKDIIFS